ncbi:hypothetical protein [Streptomyces beihaiensis]|uniref:Uncharacterized protein n=1 Tax=Streptomyces beihaiensis TaxID=2984495 RepID=A0ABT3TYP7_9ACTN|nr:hypothetical protein [Streptomyces beihaiensis]MCX3062179.1 hypothetical protein [Streptomyces beihaiensis]
MNVTVVVHDHVALAEIELCGELIIAASTVAGDRLSADRIDEVLRVERADGGTGRAGSAPAPARAVR